jgi:hypothetical protein
MNSVSSDPKFNQYPPLIERYWNPSEIFNAFGSVIK